MKKTVFFLMMGVWLASFMVFAFSMLQLIIPSFPSFALIFALPGFFFYGLVFWSLWKRKLWTIHVMWTGTLVVFLILIPGEGISLMLSLIGTLLCILYRKVSRDLYV